jgi:hypothetical protein
MGASKAKLIQRKPLSLLETFLAGAGRIPVDGAGRELAAAPALDGVVQADDHRPGGHKGFHQKAEQHAGRLSGRPTGAIQHPMVVLETGFAGQAQGAQGGGDGVVGRRQQRAAEQGLRAQPTGPSK